MVEKVDDARTDDPLDAIEILDHAARGPFRFERTADGDLEPVRMPVDARALAPVERKRVSGLETEPLAYEDLEFSLRSHRFQTSLQVGEEAAGDVAVDDAMIE